MAQLLDIEKVCVGPRSLTATVRVTPEAPLWTSEDVEATARVYWLMPSIAEQVCLGDESISFQEVMGDTELPHLLEHVTVELMARTGLAGDVACGRTRATAEERVYEVELACPDDVLVASALSSAAWILEWAYGGGDPEAAPDVDAIVEGIGGLVSASFGTPGDEAVAGESATDEPVADETVAVEAQAEEPSGDVSEAAEVVEEAVEPALADDLAGAMPATRRV